MKLKLLLFLFVLLPSSSAWADVEINATNFPDEKFRDLLLRYRFGSDGVLKDAEIAEIRSLYVNNGVIRSLKGLEYFKALEELFCYSNQLTSLDVSKLLCLHSKIPKVN